MVRRALVVAGRGPMMEKVRRLDAEIWCLQRPGFVTPHPEGAGGASLVFDYLKPDVVDFVAALHAAFPFDCVVSATEDALLATARINDRLGLGGTTEKTVRLLLDKAAMRKVLDESGVSPVRARVCSTEDDLLKFAASAGYPFIVKPVGASSSFGVRKVDDAAAAAAAAAAYAGMNTAEYLAEEYLDGREVSVEAFSFDGQHTVISITDTISDVNYIETGHSLPTALDSADAHQVVDLVKRFLDVVRLRDGASHTEVKLTAKGPRIVEGHNRRGGDRINEMVNFVYGIDFELATVAWPLGLMEPILDRPAARGGAAVRFFEAPRGTLLRVEGAEEARAMDEVAEFHVNVKPGNYLDIVRHSLDRAGYVTVFAEDVKKAVTVAENSARTIRFVTDGKVQELGNRLGELSSQLDLTSQLR